METIRIYLENMFSRLPRTPEIIKLENDMLRTMEDKYEELKMEGKSENEAIGIVISEFGNIDELIDELGLLSTAAENGAGNVNGGFRETGNSGDASGSRQAEGFADYDSGDIYLSRDQVEQVISDTRKYHRMMGIGIALCIIGPAFMILLGGIFSPDNPTAAGFIRDFSSLHGLLTLFPLFLGLAVGLSLIIYGSSRLEQYKFLKHSNLIVSPSLQSFIMSMQADFQPQYAVITTIGIVLCVLSPFILIIISQIGESTFLGEENGGTIGVFFMLLFIAIAVYLFVTSSGEEEIYKILLQEKKWKAEKKEEHFTHSSNSTAKTISLILSVYWPLVTCFYFVWSFFIGSWSTSWLIWILASVVRNVLSSVLKDLEPEKKKKEKKKEA